MHDRELIKKIKKENTEGSDQTTEPTVTYNTTVCSDHHVPSPVWYSDRTYEQWPVWPALQASTCHLIVDPRLPAPSCVGISDRPKNPKLRNYAGSRKCARSHSMNQP